MSNSWAKLPKIYGAYVCVFNCSLNVKTLFQAVHKTEIRVFGIWNIQKVNVTSMPWMYQWPIIFTLSLRLELAASPRLHLVQVCMTKAFFNDLTISVMLDSSLDHSSSLLFFSEKGSLRSPLPQQWLTWSWWIILFTNYFQPIRTSYPSWSFYHYCQQLASLENKTVSRYAEAPGVQPIFVGQLLFVELCVFVPYGGVILIRFEIYTNIDRWG